MTYTFPKKKDTRLKTNLAGKLYCDFFMHIQIAGSAGIPESVLDTFITTFYTDDNSHPPVSAKILDSYRLTLEQLSSPFTLLSHGLNRDDFIQKVLTEVKDSNPKTPMVVYCYKKLK